MDYFVFTITDKCIQDNNINNKKAKNLDRIISSVLGDNKEGRPGEIKNFKIKESIDLHKISQYRDNFSLLKETNPELEMFIVGLAQDLLETELVEEKDGTKRRNMLITPGVLIIQREIDKLILLKLEETESYEKESFEPKDAFVAERRYYKAAIITMNSIKIIDKNRKVANYWINFLKLEKENDDSEITKNLISKFKSDDLVLKEIDPKIRKEINNVVRRLILSETRFESEDWLDELNNELNKKGITFQNIEDVFTGDSLNFMDESFVIDKVIAKRAFKTTIILSKQITIEAINIETAIRNQKIQYLNGNLLIEVAEEFKERILKLFSENGGD